jgi:3-deoxy-manno-octulosonate cytidylyltransferase (CMP-KDO synthetase)
MHALVIIPARMGSSRLPGKPLADIHGKPMIVHVAERARAAAIGEVLVAAAEAEIAAAAEKAGFAAILTDPALPSGSDRIAAALESFDPAGRYQFVVNLQGDLPTIAPEAIRAALEPLAAPGFDIATLVAPLSGTEAHTPSIVKAACAFPDGAEIAPALYFSRAVIPWGEGPLWHHIGIYAYRRAALLRFVSLPPSGLERREQLEQLRALEAGLRIGARRIEEGPFGVDTPADLARARALLAPPSPPLSPPAAGLPG